MTGATVDRAEGGEVDHGVVLKGAGGVLSAESVWVRPEPGHNGHGYALNVVAASLVAVPDVDTEMPAFAVPDALPDPGFFEGAEKLLEIVFAEPAGAGKELHGGARGLRKVSRAQWADLLKVVRCEIVSQLSNDYVDAYVLR